MSNADDTYLMLAAFVQELARCGMRHACTSPGSRSAPLVLSLAREPGLRCYSHVDERCAGFFALGLAKAGGLPVAVAVTSGTAVAELLPAAVEAREARVPMLVLSADRPAELRENGAGQAIDQIKLLGSAAKWFFEVELPRAGEAQLRWMRALACRAYWTTLEGRAGVVHLNFPLREPLLPEGPPAGEATARPRGAPYLSRLPTAPAAVPQELLDLLAGARRGVVVAGRHERPDPLGVAAAAFAEARGWPLLADPMSGARRGSAAVAHYDALLREPRFAAAMAPDLVLRVGDLPVSKPLRRWLAELAVAGTTQVALDPEGAWQDPDAALTHTIAIDPTRALTRLAAAAGGAEGAHEDWLASWRSADERAAEAIAAELHPAGRAGGGAGGAAGGALSEPALAAELGVLLAGETTLFVASSMPVRDIETFWPVRADPPRVLCNRGANGIDGTVSSAFGAAAAGGRVVLLIGDVALAHDVGGLLAATRLGLAITIVALDNGGGGIFDFLPVAGAEIARAPEPNAQPAQEDRPAAGRAPDASSGEASGEPDIYTRHVATPTGLSPSALAAAFGLGHERAQDAAELRGALERALGAPRTTIVEVTGSRAANVEVHRRVWEAVAAALSR